MYYVCNCYKKKSDKRSPLDFDGLTDFVIETDHEMKEVGFPQVGGRLFSKVDSSNTNAEKGHTFSSLETQVK